MTIATVLRAAMRTYARLVPFDRGKRRMIELVGRLADTEDRNLVARSSAGFAMEFDLTSYIEREIYYFGFYRPWILPHFLDALEPWGTVLDIGANVGQYTLVAASILRERGSVIAVEPDPFLFRRLERNCALNDHDNVRLVRAAVSDEVGELEFHTRAPNDSNQGQGSVASFSFHETSLRVPAVTVDYLAPDAERVTFLKVDTQGAELHVLRGAVATLERSRPNILLRTTHAKSAALGGSTTEVQQFLLQRGYRLWRILPSKPLLEVAEPRAFEDLTLLAKASA